MKWSAVCLGAVLQGQTALAQVAGPLPSAPPEVAPATVPSEPSARHTGSTLDHHHRHDGVFLRAALGAGLFRAANKSSSAVGDRRVFRGTTGSLQLVLGGTVQGFVAMGGAYLRDRVFGLSSQDSVVDGDEPDLDGYRMTLHSIGYFVDFYLGPSSGSHLQLMLGRAWLQVNAAEGDDALHGNIAHVGLGHELWIAADVLVGGLLGVSYTHLDGNEGQGNFTLRAGVPGIYLSATMN